LIKLDRDLNFRWIRSWGEADFDDVAYQVRVSRSHDYIYVMGLTQHNNLLFLDKPFIHRLDKWGEQVNAFYEFYGSTIADSYELASLLITETDDEDVDPMIYTCGTFNNAGNVDMFWMEFDVDLVLQRTVAYGIPTEDELNFGGCAIDVDSTHLLMTFASDFTTSSGIEIDEFNNAAQYTIDGSPINPNPYASGCGVHDTLDNFYDAFYREIENDCTNDMFAQV